MQSLMTNGNHQPFWRPTAPENVAATPNRLGAAWNAGLVAPANGSPGLAAVTTPAPSLANWANRNLARRMMMFNSHLVSQTTPAISVTENEKFIRWRDNGREFIPVEAAPGRPALMRMISTPNRAPGLGASTTHSLGHGAGRSQGAPAMNDFYWANRVFPTGAQGKVALSPTARNPYLVGPTPAATPSKPPKPKPTGWARFLPENLDAGIAAAASAAAAAAVTATPPAPVKPIDWRNFLPENLAKIANKQQNEHLKGLFQV